MMTPDEAVSAATLGGARALRRDDVGYLTEGARADFVVVNAPNPTYLAYRPGVDLIGEVWRGGDLVHGSSRMGDDD
jgi:imidazolonepropionase